MTVKDSLWKEVKEETAEEFSLLDWEDFRESPSECYFVTGDALGGGDHGRELLMDFFVTMADRRSFPQSVILMDRAVLFLRKTDPLYSVFMEMEKNGTFVAASAKSIALYAAEDEIDPLFAAETGRIQEILRRADKVITL
ncbi:MAG: hypothetical protein ACI3W6_06945 [Clostridia bacterium]